MLFQSSIKIELIRLSLSHEEWNSITLLESLLEPFYIATVQLQKQKFPTLATSKIIENSLFEFFEKKSSSLNSNEQERWIAEKIVENLKKYLIENISVNQKSASLVIIQLI